MGSRPLYAKAVGELPLSAVELGAGTSGALQRPALAVGALNKSPASLNLEFSCGRLLIL